MDVVENSGSVCRISYFHEKITDMYTPVSSAAHRLPVNSKLHYHPHLANEMTLVLHSTPKLC